MYSRQIKVFNDLMSISQLNNMVSEIVLNLTLRVRSSENPEEFFDADSDSDDPRILFNLTSTLVSELRNLILFRLSHIVN
jgi:hypothetical protein